MKTETYNNTWMRIGNTGRGRYTIESTTELVKAETTDAEIYDFFDEENEQGEWARNAALGMLEDAARRWVYLGVATYNANPFCIEGDAIADVVASILQHGVEKADAEDCEKLDIDADEAGDYDFYRTGDGCYFAIGK